MHSTAIDFRPPPLDTITLYILAPGSRVEFLRHYDVVS